jgi:hypothetical protein
MYSEGGMGEMDKLVYLELQGKMDVKELKVLKETWVPWVLLDLKGLLDKEDPSMSGGGKTTCPHTPGTELGYSGFAAGSSYI